MYLSPLDFCRYWFQPMRIVFKIINNKGTIKTIKKLSGIIYLFIYLFVFSGDLDLPSAKSKEAAVANNKISQT